MNIFIGDSNIKSLYCISKLYYRYFENELNIYTNKNGNDNNNCYSFIGASMYGITKDGKLKVRDNIKKITKDNTNNYFFLFGFVDINYIIFFKKIKNNNFCEYTFIRNICKKYIEFLRNLKRNIYIFEIPYITIKDSDKFNSIFTSWFTNNEDKQLAIQYFKFNKYNQKSNIKLTKYFNNLLEKECNRYNIIFIKYNYFVVDKYDNIKSKFITSDLNDHHYKCKEILPIYISILSKLDINI